jgi:hypothetical protein
MAKQSTTETYMERVRAFFSPYRAFIAIIGALLPKQSTTDNYIERALAFISRYRAFIAVLGALVCGTAYYTTHAYDPTDPLLASIAMAAPSVATSLRASYLFILFGLPFFMGFLVLSQVYVRAVEGKQTIIYQPLPPYPDVHARKKLFLVLGETHNPTDFERAQQPTWCVQPERGLYTGIGIFGGVGGGKTSSLMYPLVKQLVGFKAKDAGRKLGGIVIEVKGNFCLRVQKMLIDEDRADDYVEIGLDSEFCYNPLFNDLDAYAQAFGIASMMAQVFGKSTEPYWTIQSTNLMKNIIRLYRLADGYVTIMDILRTSSDLTKLAQKLKETKQQIGSTALLLIRKNEYTRNYADLKTYNFQSEKIAGNEWFQAEATRELADKLKALHIDLWPRPCATKPEQQDALFVYGEIERWVKEWHSYDQELRSSILSSVSGVLSLFTDTPQAARVFCPPKSAYFPETDAPYATDRTQHLKPLQKFSVLLEQGKVIGINFPTAMNPNLAKILCTMIKSDFQAAMINRIPIIEKNPDKYFRPVFKVIDEYHLLCTLGGTMNTGDDQFFALSRESRCIAILATQSITSIKTATGGGETYKTLLQAIRTQLCLGTSDLDTAKYFADVIGKIDKLKLSVNVSETSQDANVSLITGRTVGEKSTVSQSMKYSTAMEYVFEPSELIKLKNATAAAVIFDGYQAHTQALFTLPYFTGHTKTWHEKWDDGELSGLDEDEDSRDAFSVQEKLQPHDTTTAV